LSSVLSSNGVISELQRRMNKQHCSVA
jgi:hypothetical protein